MTHRAHEIVIPSLFEIHKEKLLLYNYYFLGQNTHKDLIRCIHVFEPPCSSQHVALLNLDKGNIFLENHLNGEHRIFFN